MHILRQLLKTALECVLFIKITTDFIKAPSLSQLNLKALYMSGSRAASKTSLSSLLSWISRTSEAALHQQVCLPSLWIPPSKCLVPLSEALPHASSLSHLWHRLFHWAETLSPNPMKDQKQRLHIQSLTNPFFLGSNYNQLEPIQTPLSPQFFRR